MKNFGHADNGVRMRLLLPTKTAYKAREAIAYCVFRACEGGNTHCLQLHSLPVLGPLQGTVHEEESQTRENPQHILISAGKFSADLGGFTDSLLDEISVSLALPSDGESMLSVLPSNTGEGPVGRGMLSCRFRGCTWGRTRRFGSTLPSQFSHRYLNSLDALHDATEHTQCSHARGIAQVHGGISGHGAEGQDSS